MKMRQVSLQFFAVPTSAPYSYFISVLLLSEKHAGEAKQCSSGYHEAPQKKIFSSTQEKSFDLEGLGTSLSPA
jgi:hypothetical protein